MIKGTNSTCLIKSIRVSKSKAYITLVVASKEFNSTSTPFNIYLKDYNLDTVIQSNMLASISDELDSTESYYKVSNIVDTEYTDTLLSNTTYWIDMLENYGDDSFNENIEMYKEITLEIDISNGSKSSIIKNKFVRYISIFFKNKITSDIIWMSEQVLLISKEISIPKIENVLFETDSRGKIYGKFSYKYSSDADFNYNNSYLFTVIVIKSPQTNATLEAITIEEESFNTSEIKFQTNLEYTDTVLINIILKNYYGSENKIHQWIDENNYTTKLTGGSIVKSYSYYYTPEIKYSNMYVKTNNTYKKISQIYKIGKMNQIGLKPLIKDIDDDISLVRIGSKQFKIITPVECTYDIYVNNTNVLTTEENIIDLSAFPDSQIYDLPMKIVIHRKDIPFYNVVTTSTFALSSDYTCCDDTNEYITVCSTHLKCTQSKTNTNNDSPRFVSVTYIANNSIVKVESVVFGESSTPPNDNPSREGWTFYGWIGQYTDVSDSVIIKARWARTTRAPCQKCNNGILYKCNKCYGTGLSYTDTGTIACEDCSGVGYTKDIIEAGKWYSGYSETICDVCNGSGHIEDTVYEIY